MRKNYFDRKSAGMLLGCVVLLFVVLLRPALAVEAEGEAAEEAQKTAYGSGQEVLYVAGTITDYPIEYYDTKSAAFHGIMPDILDAVTERTGIAFQYMDKSMSREALLKGRQVDLIADFKYSDEDIEKYRLTTSGILFVFPRDGAQEQVCLAFTDIVDENMRRRVSDALEEIKEEELERILLKNLSLESWEYYHHYIELAVRILCVSAAALALIFAVMVKKYRRQYYRSLYEDVRTGHTNSRRLEKDYLEQITDEVRCRYCVINVYACNFPDIKEIYGFKEANQLLLLISDVMKAESGGKEMFTRISGDNYILIWKYNNEQQIKMRVENLLRQIAQSVSGSGKEYQLMLNAGIYFLAYHDSDLNEPVYKAVLARRSAAKLKQKVYAYEEADKLTQEREGISAAELEQAFSGGEFITWFQPQVSLAASSVSDDMIKELPVIVGYEVLARWQHPKRGLLFPNQFLSVLEDIGMLFRFDMELFGQVCSYMHERAEEGKKLLPVFFNFSADSFMNDRFLQQLLDITQKYGVPPEYMGIEITEILAHADRLNVADLVNGLHEHRFRLALDRFGVGNTSLIDLERYHVDYVKLAPEFLADIDNSKIKNILAGVIALCHTVSVKVIGNGVEEEKQELLLKNAGCDIAQGYRYFYPMPYDELKKLEYMEQ